MTYAARQYIDGLISEGWIKIELPTFSDRFRDAVQYAISVAIDSEQAHDIHAPTCTITFTSNNDFVRGVHMRALQTHLSGLSEHPVALSADMEATKAEVPLSIVRGNDLDQELQRLADIGKERTQEPSKPGWGAGF